MDVFPSKCPSPRIARSGSTLEARTQSLFDDVCTIVKPASVLEIGSWMGASAIAWARTASKHTSDFKVYCLDTWLGSVEHYLSRCGEAWSIEQLGIQEDGPSFFDEFLFNVHQAGYADRILPFRADSSSALPFFAKAGLRFDVIYVDGAHDAHSVLKDVAGSLRLLSDRGVVCGDDFGWDSVRDGLLLTALLHRRLKLRFYTKGTDFMVLREPSPTPEALLRAGGYSRWRPVSPRLLTRPLSTIKRVVRGLTS